MKNIILALSAVAVLTLAACSNRETTSPGYQSTTTTTSTGYSK